MSEALAYRQGSLIKEAVVYLAVIITAEVVTMFVHPLGGLVAHAVILATLIVRSSRTEDKTLQQLTLSLSLVPLIRIVDLSMSLSLISVPILARFALVYTPLIITSIVVTRTLDYRWDEVGLKLRVPPAQFLIALSGLAFGWVEYQILRPEALITQLTPSQALPISIILLVFTGFAEEFAFRGVLQRSATEAFGWRGIVYVSVLFAAMHMGFQSWLDVVFVFGVAMFFGWAVKKTGSLVGVTLAHGLANIMLFVILPFFF